MTRPAPIKIGGVALAMGFLAVLFVLFRNPTAGWIAATNGVPSLLYFLVLPTAGVLAGVYASRGGPFRSIFLFVFGSYLGVVGVALTFGSLLASRSIGVVLAIGVLVMILAVVSLVASLSHAVETLQFGTFQMQPE